MQNVLHSLNTLVLTAVAVSYNWRNEEKQNGKNFSFFFFFLRCKNILKLTPGRQKKGFRANQAVFEYTVSWKKYWRNGGSQLGFLNNVFIILPNCFGVQSSSTDIHVNKKNKCFFFLSENFWVPFSTPSVLFLPFFDLMGS